MSRLFPLFSSSKGNCTYLSGGGTALLVDMGVSLSALVAALASHDLALDNIRAVLVTHEHTDHIKGLCTLLKKKKLPVCASGETLAYLAERGLVPPGAQLVEVSGAFCVDDIGVQAFPTPHDAVEPVGYRFTMPDGSKVAVATDLGHINDTVRGYLAGCDVVMLESNYDRGMLDCSRYPYYLKRRIKGEFGHLSNELCAGEAARLVRSGTTRIVLAHLSEQNNLPALAYEAARAMLNASGLRENLDYILKVAPARNPQEMLVF